MYICSHMLCVPIFPVYLLVCLSIFMHNIYLGYEKTDVGRGVILK